MIRLAACFILEAQDRSKPRALDLIFLLVIVHFVGGPAKGLHDLRPISPNIPHQFDCIVENSALFEHGSNLVKGHRFCSSLNFGIQLHAFCASHFWPPR